MFSTRLRSARRAAVSAAISSGEVPEGRVTAGRVEEAAPGNGALTAPWFRFHTASMPNILIRDVPAEVHGELARRAERQGRSLQQYLTALLTREATTRTLDDVLDSVDRLQGGHFSLTEAFEALRRSATNGDRPRRLHRGRGDG